MAKKTTKKTTKKVAAKKAPTKKVATKKAVKKAVTPTPAKKAPAKKVAKKAPAKKVAAKKVTKTSILARIDVGFGNSLFIRGEGAGLSWGKGTLMDNVTPYEWVFDTTQAKTGVVFKFLINDEIWAEGENLSVSAGGTSISTPSF